MKLTGEYSQFIGSYSNIYSDEFCDEIIKTFDYYQSINHVYCEDTQFPNSNAGRFDWAFDLHSMGPSMDSDPVVKLYEPMHKCLDEYRQVFGTLKDVPVYSIVQKVQKTPPGGGYHVWHDENSNLEHCRRVIVWMVYLNDDFKGGETEFFFPNNHQQIIKPIEGSVIVFPPNWQFPHRGRKVTSENKYIMSSYFHFIDE